MITWDHQTEVRAVAYVLGCRILGLSHFLVLCVGCWIRAGLLLVMSVVGAARGCNVVELLFDAVQCTHLLAVYLRMMVDVCL